ncbi:hypothetical protein T01_4145 [Trichinella spiralis]|uniref:Uncharacterized protein n=1 Tax=Trichinella spiralis TaxID=6334 RepID=A0A0V0Z7E0_TRISP|nr:hypothetical protein T01_4145 [Trichinella spiralis]
MWKRPSGSVPEFRLRWLALPLGSGMDELARRGVELSFHLCIRS